MRLLTVNTGSSSLKAGVYELASAEGSEPQAAFSASAEEIGSARARLRIEDKAGRNGAGTVLLDLALGERDHGAALEAMLDWLAGQGEGGRFAGAGHRIVVGNGDFLAARRLDRAAIGELKALLPLAPDHLPPALAAIAALTRRFPTLPQATCSDSGFHRGLPAPARTAALPAAWRERGIARWGFHGLSCESAMAALKGMDATAAAGRVVVAHLGNGASLTAIRGGRSVDTTMGLTPTGGLIMSRRCGDLDPGIAVYLAGAGGLDAAGLNRLVNQDSGLLGLSGLSSDMRALLAAREREPAAALAVACFVWQAKKFLAAMTAALGGLETLIFTGGIGEHSAAIRAEICQDMGWMGLRLDAERNQRAAGYGTAVISAGNAAVTVRVIPADEDRIIARHTAALLRTEGEDAHVSI